MDEHALIATKKYRFRLQMRYFEYGNSMIGYVKWLIAFWGITTVDFVTTFMFAFAYAIICYTTGRLLFKLRMPEVENEISNQFNLISKQLRKDMKDKSKPDK